MFLLPVPKISVLSEFVTDALVEVGMAGSGLASQVLTKAISLSSCESPISDPSEFWQGRQELNINIILQTKYSNKELSKQGKTCNLYRTYQSDWYDSIGVFRTVTPHGSI